MRRCRWRRSRRRRRGGPRAIRSGTSPRRWRVPGLSVIAEHKRRSPSAGPIREDLALEDVVGAYERGGAAALSILTEGPSFGGSLDDLRAARAAAAPAAAAQGLHRRPLPGARVVRRRRRRDPADRRRADGATELAALHAEALALGLSALVEVHDERELDAALSLGASVIGINNRDLTTLEVDTRRTFELLPRVLGHALVVAESGFSRPEQLDELAGAGVDAVLIGEALMRSRRRRGGVPRAGGDGEPPYDVVVSAGPTKIKFCGITSLDDAERAISAGRVGDRADLLAAVAAALRPRRRGRDRRGGQAARRGRGRVRQRDARPRRRRPPTRRPDDDPAPRRRGPGLLLRGGAADRLQGDQGGARAQPRRRPGAGPVPHRLPPARQLHRRASRRHRRDVLVGDRARPPQPGAGDPLGRVEPRQRRRGDRGRAAVRRRRRQRRRAAPRTQGPRQARGVRGGGPRHGPVEAPMATPGGA